MNQKGWRIVDCHDTTEEVFWLFELQRKRIKFRHAGDSSSFRHMKTNHFIQSQFSLKYLCAQAE
jgi:hypothetical protein